MIETGLVAVICSSSVSCAENRRKVTIEKRAEFNDSETAQLIIAGRGIDADKLLRRSKKRPFHSSSKIQNFPI